ncbi:hypothetical protein [Microbacterium sp. BK668]|uniref:hypothetical protein n=1 Tax=Microbacterium sp. BK668 TaxID=2512118 RepID=UPI00105F3984|nr:hypothetical protein [Microbacterium sp. BK668]TDN91101.1 hypothetical protein EV279_0599 [Microbacterium sp. BK668]
MDRIWTTGAPGAGSLPEARHRLSAIVTTLRVLQTDTAWECRAADGYRVSLEALSGDVADLSELARDLEGDLHGLWLRAAASGAW